MSVFAPVDQRGPDARRQQLVGKLMQQAQGHVQQNAAQSPGLAGLLGASGPSFHTGLPGAPHPQYTQGINVASDILARLGAAGHAPFTSQSSGFPGQALSLPTQAYSNLDQSAHFINQGGPPIQLPVMPNVPQGVGAGTAAPTSGPIPLGGGHFYDPMTDSVGFHPAAAQL